LTKAAIFDVDGTLLDSVDLHALAWHEAMVKFGHDVSFEQARSQIGKGGDKLIPYFLTADAQRDHGSEMEEWRGKRFKSEYLPLVRPFSAVPDLLRRVLLRQRQEQPIAKQFHKYRRVMLIVLDLLEFEKA